MCKMFKRLALVVFLLALASVAAAVPMKTTLAASGRITDSAGYLGSVIIVTDGANTCTATIYDSTVSGGTIMFGKPLFMNGTDNFGGFTSARFPFTYGLYVNISTSGTCAVTILYGWSPGDV